jgi:hypothetical protein
VASSTPLKSSPGLQALSGSGSSGNATSHNWSGYVLTNGTFTAVTGTFTVPSVEHYVAGSTVSEWVGLDGWTDGALIQAGVNEVPKGPGATMIVPWWEILPSPQRLATGVTVHSGDAVTVAISQAGAGKWSVKLTDDSNGTSFSTSQSYAGARTSAEWVVEANTLADGSLTTLADYSPSVTFTNAAVAGPQTALSSVALVQGGQDVSTPSAVEHGVFEVAYGNMTPPVPPLGGTSRI